MTDITWDEYRAWAKRARNLPDGIRMMDRPGHAIRDFRRDPGAPVRSCKCRGRLGACVGIFCFRLRRDYTCSGTGICWQLAATLAGSALGRPLKG